MKIKHLLIATSLALATAPVALAADKEALKKAKEEAKAKAIEAAKEKSKDKAATAKAVSGKKADIAKAAAEEKAKAAEDEKQTHAKHLGLIDRLTQIATATNNAELTATVARITEKEGKRHTLAAGQG